VEQNVLLNTSKTINQLTTKDMQDEFTIRGSHSMELKISEEEHRRAAITYIFKKFNWQYGYYIEDDKVKRNKVYYGSHSFSLPESIRDANKID